MSRKNRKSGTKRAGQNGSRQSRTEATGGKEVVDEKVVKAGGIQGSSADDFSEAGYGCDQCDWTTKKRGNAGIQALRAHSKVHVRDRRAVIHTLIIQVMVLAVTVTAALLPNFVRFAPSTVIADVRLLEVPVDAQLVVTVTAAVSILFAVAIPFTGDRYLVTGKRPWWSRYTWFTRFLMVLMLSVAGLRWTETGHAIWLPWFTPVVLPWVFWLWIGRDVALTRLAVKRRAFKPRSQRKLMKSKNRITDDRISLHRRNLKRGIRDGRIVLANFTKNQRDYLRRLGLGKIRLDKRSKQRRLKAEEDARFKAEQRALRTRRKRDSRGKRRR